MPHADASLVPDSIKTKSEFWTHVHDQLEILMGGQRHWVSNLSNAASLIYNSLQAFPSNFGDGERSVNWCGESFHFSPLVSTTQSTKDDRPAPSLSGFYLISSLFPQPRFTDASMDPQSQTRASTNMLLGPFSGRPACQWIEVSPRPRGVCGDAFVKRSTVLVLDVLTYPGHIACDGDTKSEIVCPLILRKGGEDIVVGVLDLDCLAIGGFDADDQVGLERIVALIIRSCDW
ncbi:GAF domain-like protein [Suillus variegatus]|nr:GAF domain-like protein [Suillus variegatus]